MTRRRTLLSWRWEALHTNFWFVPAVLIVAASLIYVVTFSIDVAAYYHHIQLAFWLHLGAAHAGRDVLFSGASTHGLVQ